MPKKGALNMCENEKNKEIMSETNGEEHNLIPDEKEWMDYAKDDMEDYIESQGIYIRQ